jgi:hypothetical protein
MGPYQELNFHSKKPHPLKEIIKNNVGRVHHDMLRNAWQESEYHFDVCKATNATPIELQHSNHKF